MIHRDLKPSNIFFAADGTVKVGDLGLVKDMMTDEEGHSWNNEGLQTANFVQQKHTDEIGTRLYMSPEQIALKLYSHKVDVYALAVIHFELLVRSPPLPNGPKSFLNSNCCGFRRYSSKYTALKWYGT